MTQEEENKILINQQNMYFEIVYGSTFIKYITNQGDITHNILIASMISNRTRDENGMLEPIRHLETKDCLKHAERYLQDTDLLEVLNILDEKRKLLNFYIDKDNRILQKIMMKLQEQVKRLFKKDLKEKRIYIRWCE